jgi:hypothetical protein
MKPAENAPLASGLRVRHWSAWAPGASTPEAWRACWRGEKQIGGDGSPELPEVSPLLRRRMSRLARMAAAAAFDCCRQAGVAASEIPMVFASRHGEMSVTIGLLEQMRRAEPLSPTDFSGSVHHTALGYWSIAAANRRPARAVAGGEATFCYGFLDAAGMLPQAQRVLFVAADDVTPAPFEATEARGDLPYAAAFLLTPAEAGDKGTLSLSMRYASAEAGTPPAREAASMGVPALDFLRWLEEGQAPLEMVLSRRLWRWEK